MIWLYLGPEVIAPVLSVIAAIGGVIMMFWRRFVAAVRAVARFITGKPAAELPSDDEKPIDAEVTGSDIGAR